MPGKATEAFLVLRTVVPTPSFIVMSALRLMNPGSHCVLIFSGSAEGAEVVKREFAVVVLGFVGRPCQSRSTLVREPESLRSATKSLKD